MSDLIRRDTDYSDGFVDGYKAGIRDAEPKKGKWMKKPDPHGFFDEIPVCSQCGCTTMYREEYKYCPNCGAKMEKEEAEK